MTVTCGTGMMMYLLPMMLGRTFDAQTSTVGIDIYSQDDVERAMNNPRTLNTVTSNYRTIEEMSEKRDFLGISGEFALKMSAGLLDVKGSYLKDTSSYENKVEILIKTTFISQEVVLDTKPPLFWENMDKKLVGTHVVSSLLYGGELIASVNFIAYKQKYLKDIKGAINGALSKGGAFNISAQGQLESLAKNISSKAKMEIDYYATVPLEQVPNTIEGLKTLVNSFETQVKKVNNGTGVAVCAGLRLLSDFTKKSEFDFKRNEALMDLLNNFNGMFEDLRQAKFSLKSLVSSLPQNISDDYLEQIVHFSDRVTDTLMIFHKVIGNMDFEQGPPQLEPALEAYKLNSNCTGPSPYTCEIKKLIEEKEKKVFEDPKPRGIYTHWGKRSCGNDTGDILYIGFMSSFMEKGASSGTDYQCLPENPDLHLDFDGKGSIGDESTLSAARYKSLSVFEQGNKLEDKIASCSVCQSVMRPTVEVFPATLECPGDWVQEYAGFVVTTKSTRGRAEFVCLDSDPDSYNFTPEINRFEPVVLPVKMGDNRKVNSTVTKDASLPCVVCSK